MKAIQFNATIPRYALGRALGGIAPALLWSGLSCTSYVDIPEPHLPGADWVRVRTRLGGICGSDLSAIHLQTSPYFSPITSFPYTFGHENVGEIAEIGPGVSGWKPGERVIVEPSLGCEARGFTEMCPACSRGEVNLCERLIDGQVSAGTMLGFCRDTGGSWSAGFVAHASQLYRPPQQLSDENALMVEPFSVGMHAALTHFPGEDQTVLIIGAGTIGLCTVAALRALGCQARLLVLARYPFQAEAALRLGASQVISSAHGKDYAAELARLTGMRLLAPIIGRRVPLGGVQTTFDCVGSSLSADDALHFTRSGGKVVLVANLGQAKGIDWSAVFQKELDVQASFVYHHAEPYAGKAWRAFDLALHLMESGQVDLGWMVTHRFRLEDYRRALALTSRHGANRIIKAVFEFPG